MSDQLTDVYASLAERYTREASEVRDDLISRRVLIKLVKEFAGGGRVLDCGCGEGSLARRMARVAGEVVGVDASSEFIDAARAKRPPRGTKGRIRYVVGDMRNLAEFLPAGSFDLAVLEYALCCMESEEDVLRVFRGVADILRPGGFAIVQNPNPLEYALQSESMWAQDLDFPESYHETGRLIRRNLSASDGSVFRVARFHMPFGKYVSALPMAGLKLIRVLEPRPSRYMVRKYPTLAHERNFPSSIILVATRPDDVEG